MFESKPNTVLQSRLPLNIGVSTRALFDLEEEHALFEAEGVAAYSELQRAREKTPLKPGAAFEVVRRLLALNPDAGERLVEVIVLSRNSPDLSLRAAVAAGARLGSALNVADQAPFDEVWFAFDGDAVVFSAESDLIYKEQGLEKFLEHEIRNAEILMSPGSFGKSFLPKLAELRKRFMRPDGTSRIRTAIVTARNAPAYERVIQTLRSWGTPADEAHFVGGHEKAPILAATGAHIFFDDQECHIDGASGVVPAGLVPGPHDPDAPVIPASN